MSYLAFELTMPGCPSWNGRWSGERDRHVLVQPLGRTAKSVAKAAKVLAGAPYTHRWSDGWRASIDVRIVDGVEARKLRKQSSGFCGYDWMVKNIMLHGCTERREPAAGGATP